jgi:hypothetical protein
MVDTEILWIAQILRIAQTRETWSIAQTRMIAPGYCQRSSAYTAPTGLVVWATINQVMIYHILKGKLSACAFH